MVIRVCLGCGGLVRNASRHPQCALRQNYTNAERDRRAAVVRQHRATHGDVCPGYPKQLQVGTSNINGPGAVAGTKIYTHLLPDSSYTQTAPIALFCWDAATDRGAAVASGLYIWRVQSGRSSTYGKLIIIR